MRDEDIHSAIAILREAMPQFPQPLIDGMNESSKTPFRILIATILSLQSVFSYAHAGRVSV
jgi:endonuclease III